MTGVQQDNDYNSLWTIKEAELPIEVGKEDVLVPPCKTGTLIKCGDFIRLEQMNTGKNLHSHANFDSPVSRRQEVSAFGDQGDGDRGMDLGDKGNCIKATVMSKEGH